MPKVPSSDGPTIQNKPMPAPQLAEQTIRAPAAAFGGGGEGLAVAGQALAQLGHAGMAHAAQMVEDDSKTAAQQALSLFQDSKRAKLFHADDAFSRQTGEVAYKSYDKLAPMLEEERARLGEGLSEGARKLYDQTSLRDVSGDLDSAARHAATEREKWRDGVTASLADSSIADAASAWNDPAKRNEALTFGRNAILDRAAEKNWDYDAPQLQTALRDFEAKAAAALIGRAVADDPLQGKALFDQYKGKLSPEHYGAISRQVEAHVEKYEVQAAVARINTTITGATGPGSPAGSVENNPGNLMPGGKFATFATPEAGVAATVRNLQTYPGKYGADTLATIAQKWAPLGHGDNDPAVWAKNVGTFAGIDPAAKLDLTDKALLARLLPAIARQEKGAGKAAPFTADVVGRGIDLAAGAPPAPEPNSASSPFASDADVYAARLAEAAKIEAPETRAAALASLTHQWSQKKAVEAQREKEAKDKVLDLVLTRKVDPNAIPADLVAQVGPDFMIKARDLAAKDGKAPFNPALENQMHAMVIHDSEGFAKFDVGSLYGQHDTGRVQYWQGVRRQYANKDVREQARLNARTPSYALGDRVVSEMFPSTGRASDDDKLRNAKAKEFVRKWADQWHDEGNKGTPKAEDVYRVVRGLTLKEDGPWYRPDTMRIDALGSGDAAKFPVRIDEETLPDVAAATGIPREIIPAVVEFLKTRKDKAGNPKPLPITMENLLKAYEDGRT